MVNSHPASKLFIRYVCVVRHINITRSQNVGKFRLYAQVPASHYSIIPPVPATNRHIHTHSLFHPDTHTHITKHSTLPSPVQLHTCCMLQITEVVLLSCRLWGEFRFAQTHSMRCSSTGTMRLQAIARCYVSEREGSQCLRWQSYSLFSFRTTNNLWFSLPSWKKVWMQLFQICYEWINSSNKHLNMFFFALGNIYLMLTWYLKASLTRAVFLVILVIYTFTKEILLWVALLCLT